MATYKWNDIEAPIGYHTDESGVVYETYEYQDNGWHIWVHIHGHNTYKLKIQPPCTPVAYEMKFWNNATYNLCDGLSVTIEDGSCTPYGPGSNACQPPTSTSNRTGAPRDSDAADYYWIKMAKIPAGSWSSEPDAPPAPPPPPPEPDEPYINYPAPGGNCSEFFDIEDGCNAFGDPSKNGQ